jgi:hypothetical protein
MGRDVFRRMVSSSLRACSTLNNAHASEPSPPASETATTISANADPAIDASEMIQLATQAGVKTLGQVAGETTSKRFPPALVHTGFVPQGEFDPVVHANLVVDLAQVVPDNVFADPKFPGDFTVFQSSGDQFDDSLLAGAELQRSVSIFQPSLAWQFSLALW